MTFYELLTLSISGFALLISVGATAFSFRADRLARESVRPFVSTGVRLLTNDLSVSLSNFGVGLAIIKQIAMSGGDAKSTTSLLKLLPQSENYEIKHGISFVQNEYYLRPGEKMILAAAGTKAGQEDSAALQDWISAIDGISIEIQYDDILGRHFRYSRVISVSAI